MTTLMPRHGAGLALALAFLAALGTAAPARSQTPPSGAPAERGAEPSRRVLRPARATGELRVDGRLDEDAWAAAEASGGFTQSYPQAGEPASERTEVRILYDQEALYVGVRAFDSRPDSIAAQLARRDAADTYSDWIEVSLDTYRDRRSGFRFAVNPRGVKRDAALQNDFGADAGWDAVWQAGTSTDSLGWTAELRIPFSQLRLAQAAAGGERVWGVQVQRDIARRSERDTWSPWTRQDGGFVSHFGDLPGLVGIPMPRHLELVAYTSTTLTRAPGDEANPFYRANDVGARAGADVRAGLPGGLVLTATINPDFGQVEADPAVLNLSAFETFFPERRPFFLEGADVFSFGPVRSLAVYGTNHYFYSRRIGAAPRRDLSATYPFVDAPSETRILGAAKVSGRAGGWAFGLLDAVTGREQAEYVDGAGVRARTPIEPLTNYFVGRVRRDLPGGGTRVGGILTSVQRSLSDSTLSAMARSRAHLAGVDFDHTWGGRGWALSGGLTLSRVDGSPAAIALAQRSSARYYQRPDAGYLRLDDERRSLAGHLFNLALVRSGRTAFSVDYKESSPGFEMNDLGFQGRTDFRSVSALVRHGVDRAGRVFRRREVYLYDMEAWNFGGDHVYSRMGASVAGTFVNFATASAYLNLSPGTANDRLTRGGPLGRNPTQADGGIVLGTDARKALSGSVQAAYGRDAEGGRDAQLRLNVAYRPSASLTVSAGPGLRVQRNPQQYVSASADPAATETFGTSYLFARLDQTTLSIDTRVNWTFTPTLSFEMYAQPFVGTGAYSRFKTLRRPGTLEYDPAPAPATSPDFNLRSLRGNAVLRWEYRTGSTLYLLWQQRRSETLPWGDFSMDRDLPGVLDAPAQNVFAVKLTYWIGG